MNNIQSYIGVLWPLILINIILIVIALRDIFKSRKYKYGNRIFWICIVLFIQILGPILYLLLGRDD